MLNEIGKTFGGVRAVHNVSLTLESGNIYGLIGPNGAGKSTLVNLISGVLSSSEGTIALAGHSIDRMSAHQRARHGIARTFQNLRVFPSLTVAQNIDVAGYSRPRKDRARSHQLAQDAINAFDLRDKLSQPAGSLSYGHLRRLEIVRALALNPDVLVADEPTSALDGHSQSEFMELLFEQVHSAGASLLMASHDERLADHFDDVIRLADIVQTGGDA